jgi:hypothetical protein
VFDLGGRRQQAGLLAEVPLASDAVDRAVAGSRQQPARRVGGLAVDGPSLGRDGERLLRGFLGELEVAEEADERSEDPTPLLTEGLLEDQ